MIQKYSYAVKNAVLTFIVFFSLLRYSGGTISDIRLMHVFIIVPLYLLFSHSEQTHGSMFLSGLFSLFLTIGFSMREKEVFLDQSLAGYAELAIFWLGMFLFIRKILSVCGRYISDSETTGNSDRSLSRRKGFLMLLLCWLPYYICMFPGGIWYDVGGEMEQFFGAAPYNNINPFLQTLLIGSFTDLGMRLGSATIGVGLYIGVQALISALVINELVITVAELLHLSAAAAKKCLLLYALVPVYPLFVFAVGKDLNWSISILFCITNLIRLFHDPEKYLSSYRNRFALILSLMLVSLLRNSGIPVAVLLCIISLLSWKQLNEKRTVLLTCLGIYGVCITSWYMVFLPAMHVSTVGNAKENYSVPLLQVGRAFAYYPEDFSEEDEEIIGRVVDINAVKYDYVPYNSDSIKETFNNSASSEDINAFIEVYKKEFRKRPLCYLDSMIAKSYAYFDPDDLGSPKAFAVGGNYAESRLLPLGIEIHYITERMPYYVAGLISRFRLVPVLGCLTKCGMWIWIYLYCLANIRKKLPKRYLALFLPGLLIMIGLVFTPINGYFRYALPVVMMVPAALMICLGEGHCSS